MVEITVRCQGCGDPITFEVDGDSTSEFGEYYCWSCEAAVEDFVDWAITARFASARIGVGVA